MVNSNVGVLCIPKVAILLSTMNNFLCARVTEEEEDI